MTRREKVTNMFCDFMEKKGFHILLDEDIERGGMAVHNDDDFVPIFSLRNWNCPDEHCIFVDDRNGSFIVSGDTAAIYSLEVDETWTEKEILNKFKEMLDDVYEKYGQYSKSNRLDFVFNEMEMERKEYGFKEKETDNSLNTDDGMEI